MKKLNLQLFAEAVQGKDIVYLYRILSEEATADGTCISFVTENGRTKSTDSETTVTKDGNVTTPGAIEEEVTSTSIFSKDDPMPDRLEEAMDNHEIIEIWEANLAKPVKDSENKFEGRYMRGYLTEFEQTASAEEAVEHSLTFAINGNSVKGEVTVTTAQQEMAKLVFRDTTKTGA
jgi:TP901-1 family phage major tail protein